MFQGTLEAIFIGPAKSEPMREVAEVEAIAGVGLADDRYAQGSGTFSKESKLPGNPLYPRDRQVTLIEAEAIEAANADGQLQFAAAQSRRNLLVRGVPLNHLIDKEFQIGQVRIRGLRLCEPCGHLEKLTTPGIKTALLHRGGLRAEILTSGTLHAGDVVKSLAPPNSHIS